MSNDLQVFEQWVAGLLLKLGPGQRTTINRRVAQDLRRGQAKRIASQHNPDGSEYTPRKTRQKLRSKIGRIKRQRAAMFERIRLQKNLKVESNANGIGVGFIGRVARIARTHQEGLSEKVSKNGPEHHYVSRQLLGLSAADRDLIRESLLRHISDL
jgi:phage virion morphogenesis protein